MPVNVEAGVSVGAASVSGLNRIEPSFGAAPIGRVSSIVNEGPVRGSLEGFRPMNTTDITTIDKGGTARPLGEIVFNSEPLTTEGVISAAEAIIAARVAKPVFPQAENLTNKVDTAVTALTNSPAEEPLPIITQPTLAVIPEVSPNPALRGTGMIDLNKAVDTHLQPEVRRVARQAASPSVLRQTEVVPAPALADQLIEGMVEEQAVKPEDRADQTSNIKEEDEVEQLKRKYVTDEHALSQIVVEFKAAVKKAKEVAGKLGIKITGELIGKFLPGQHPGNESEAVKGKGPDGSIPERKEDIEAFGEFTSEKEAEERSVDVAYKKPPIKVRSEGEPVGEEAVQRVYKFHLTKPKPVTEVVNRVVKKTKLVIQSGQKPVEAPVQPEESGSKIEDNPDLAEVFGRAAM